MKIKFNKCEFLKEKVKFLGHILTKEGLSTDPEKTKAIKDYQTPKCIKQLRSFLGLCNYYRRFIKDYSNLSNPLEKLCNSTLKKLNWNNICNENFERLKESLMSAPVLAFPDLNKTFTLDTVLSQTDENGRERVISYGSHSLSKHELGYCVTRKELLAVYYFVNQFKHYLYGRRFRVRTDHKAITYLMKTKKPISAQFQNWIGFLSGLDIEFVYRKGDKHINADTLSRRICTTCSQCQTKHEDAKKDKPKTKVLSSITKISNKWQNNNKEIEKIRNLINEGSSEFYEENGIIRTDDDRIWIPYNQRREFIRELHLKLYHAGVSKIKNI